MKKNLMRLKKIPEFCLIEKQNTFYCNHILFHLTRKRFPFLCPFRKKFQQGKKERKTFAGNSNRITGSDWKYLHLLSERLASLGTMSARLRAPLKPLNMMVK